MNLDPFSLILAGLAILTIGLYFLSLFQCFPRLILSLFLLFILFQWIIVNWVGGKTTTAGLVITYLDEAVILSLFSLIALDVLSRSKTVRLPLVIIGIGVMLASGIIGSFVGRTPFVIVISDIFIYLKGFLLFIIFAYFCYPPANLKNQVRFFAVWGIIILLLGMVELVNPVGFRSLTGNVMKLDWRVGIPSVQSLFIHPGLFGWFCGYSALFAFAFYLHKKNSGSLFLFIFFVLGVLVSMRLKVIAALTAAVISGLWIYASRTKIKMVGLIGIVAAVIVLLFRGQIAGVIQEQMEEYKNPLKPRTVLYRTSFLLAENHFPFGVGFGRFGGEVAARYYSPVYEQYKFGGLYGMRPGGEFLRDTFWPMVLGELGVIGLISYGWVLVLLFRLLLKSYKKADSIFLKAFTLGVCLVFIEGVVESLAEPVFTKPPACYFLFAAMGISCSLYNRRIKPGITNESTACS
ncbi:MAG: hypothetical protein V1789_09135 [PVC group bacterium]